MNIGALTPFISYFDYAFVTIVSLDQLQVRDLKASLLKYGYGINCEKTYMLVVNLIDDEKFFSKLNKLCIVYNVNYTVSVGLKESEGYCPKDCTTKRQERMAIKEAFHLTSYKDYQRGARQAITAIHEHFLINIH